jgi:transcription elongation factor GreA-like protein
MREVYVWHVMKLMMLNLMKCVKCSVRPNEACEVYVTCNEMREAYVWLLMKCVKLMYDT